MKKQALGRGLKCATHRHGVTTSGSSSINEIAIEAIHANPNQPRTHFDAEALEELATSIREIGIISPITLREIDKNNYEIIAGERRYRAAKMIGLKNSGLHKNGGRRPSDGNGAYRKHTARRFECYRNSFDLQQVDDRLSINARITQ